MTAAPTLEAGARHGAEHVAPDCRGLNFYAIDGALRALLPLYLPPALGAHLEPHL
jgi:hypothetical protein